jgi:limonene 1,2-monooxygenase
VGSGPGQAAIGTYRQGMARPQRLRFGTFLAPHHPIDVSPTWWLRHDLDFAEHLDRLGFDEFWCGEHHSTGWEMIASPEMFLSAAAERTSRIKLGTGVTSLPYHHPFMVAQRLVQLDHLSGGRAIFGSGPGALPSDAAMLGIDPMRQRAMQDEALGVISRLLAGETVTYECDWFRMYDAQLQILPIQDPLPMAAASSISPSGMKLAGKYGMGVLSIASNSTAGIQALPTQWGFAEASAAEHGRTVSRGDWRVLMAFHLAETREQARAEAVDGLQNWHNNYNVKVLGRPDAVHVEDKWELIDSVSGGTPGGGTAVIGTADDMIEAIRNLQELTGGFGCLLGFAHNWTTPEANFRSWEIIARKVIPAINGTLDGRRRSADVVAGKKDALMVGASQAVLAQITADDSAMAALTVTMQQRAAGVKASSSAGSAAVANVPQA